MSYDPYRAHEQTLGDKIIVALFVGGVIAFLVGSIGGIFYFEIQRQDAAYSFMKELEQKNYTVQNAEFNSPPIYILCNQTEFLQYAASLNATVIYRVERYEFFIVSQDYQTAYKYTVK